MIKPQSSGILQLLGSPRLLGIWPSYIAKERVVKKMKKKKEEINDK